MAIVNRLKQVMLEYAARRGRHLTVRELAEATDLSESTITRLASGKNTRLDYLTLNKLCVFLECQPGDLLVYVPDAPAAGAAV